MGIPGRENSMRESILDEKLVMIQDMKGAHCDWAKWVEVL